MATYHFSVPLVPIKRRVRFGRGGQYVDKRTTAEMQAVRDAYDGPFFTGAVTVGLTVFRKLPDSRPKRVASEPDTSKPDIDNVAKAVLDALKGKAYADDAQVTALYAEKQPRTRIEHDFTEIQITGNTEGDSQ